MPDGPVWTSCYGVPARAGLRPWKEDGELPQAHTRHYSCHGVSPVPCLISASHGKDARLTSQPRPAHSEGKGGQQAMGGTFSLPVPCSLRPLTPGKAPALF